MQRLTWAAFSGCLIAGLALAQSLEIIGLKYRTAQEVIPILTPLLEPGAVLSGQDYTLLVRASPANLSQLRAALAQIDRQPRQLLVSVRHGSRQEIERERAGASATVRAGNAAAAVNEAARTAPGVTVRAGSSSQRSEASGISSVQVSEGSSALIAAGTSVPIVTVIAAGAARRPWAAGVGYRDLRSGFMVTPRIAANQVVLDIAQQDERLQGGQVRTQNLQTQVSGPLGEWIQLAGIEESAASTSTGVLSRRYATASDERSIWVKVELR